MILGKTKVFILKQLAMKTVHFILVASFALYSVFNLSTKEIPQNTAYLNIQYVMISHGMILSNTISNRITYYNGGNKVIKEKVVSDINMPDDNGGTLVNKGTERFTAINEQVINFHGHYIENGSTGFLKGEKDSGKMFFYGKEKEGGQWFQVDKQDIDFYVFYRPGEAKYWYKNYCKENL